jgi:hypothetical protein
MSNCFVKLPAHPVKTGQARRGFQARYVIHIVSPWSSSTDLTPPIPLGGARFGQFTV